MRKLSLLLAAIFLAAIVFPEPQTARGMTDQERKDAFLRSRRSPPAQRQTENQRQTESREERQDDKEEAPDPTPAPQAAKTPSAKAKKPAPKPRPASRRKSTPPPDEEEEPQKESTKESQKASKKAAPDPTAEPTPTAKPAKASRTKGTSRSPGKSGAIVVEKSGTADDDELLPPPPPERRGWWPFRRSPKYKYLTPAIRKAIDRAPVARHRWRYIVVHNSGTRQGSAKAFDYYHTHVRHMPNGLAYHFVIGNGTSTGDGAIEIGNRWKRQINGGHVHSDFLNNIAIGICFVGDYNRDKPTKKQLEALNELIVYVRTRVGKTNRKLAVVKAHKDINPRPTDCPGTKFPYRWLYSTFD